MFPQLQNVMANWTEPIQMKILNKTAVDFEVQEVVLGVPVIDMMLQVMKARDVDRKPEGERFWKWMTGWSETKVPKDTRMQDPEGLEYIVGAITDWGQSGFYVYDLVQQPKGLDGVIGG